MATIQPTAANKPKTFSLSFSVAWLNQPTIYTHQPMNHQSDLGRKKQIMARLQTHTHKKQ